MGGEGRGDEPLSPELLKAFDALEELARGRGPDSGLLIVIEDEAARVSLADEWELVSRSARKRGPTVGDLVRFRFEEERRRRRDPGGPGTTGS